MRVTHLDTKIMPRYDGEMTGKRNSCRRMRWSPQGSEWKSNSKHVEHMARLWRLKPESKETPTPNTKATGRRRDIDETLMQHDVRASREAAGTSSAAAKSSIKRGTKPCRRQADPRAARMSENTLGSRRTDQGNCVEYCERTSVLRCEAIADQTDTQKVRVTWHCQTLAGYGIVVARAGSIA